MDSEARPEKNGQEAYQELVANALLADRFTLEEFPVVSQLPDVEQWTAANPRELLPQGKALRLLLRRSVDDVIEAVGEPDDVTVWRIVEYLDLRYQKHWHVKAIAEQGAVPVCRSGTVPNIEHLI